MFAGSMLVALVVDALIGWPDRLYDRIGHPVTWLGAVIDWADKGWNREGDSFAKRRFFGVLTCLGVTALAAFVAQVFVWALPEGLWGAVLTGVLAWPLVASRAMYVHVAKVARPLAAGDLQGARDAVAMIVGRDPNRLDGAGVARAALESLAENTSDGIVAPVFWGVIFGLPGIAGYKAINTMDSMIGHMSPRFRAFGWAAARLDDVVNLIPARLTGLFFVLAAGRNWRQAAKVMIADAGHHRSPNAGWPEAALAGALGVRLSGPRVYDGALSAEPWVNAGGREASAMDLARGLDLYLRAMGVMGLVMLGGALW